MNELTAVDWGILAPLIGIQFILALVAIVDIVRSEQTNGPKWLWIVICALAGMIGPILYFVIGRKNV